MTSRDEQGADRAATGHAAPGDRAAPAGHAAPGQRADLVRAGAAALAGTAVGDAVGARREGGPPTSNTAAEAIVADAVDRGPLAYTDDTQMALLLLEHVAGAGGRVDPAGYVTLLAERVQPWRGYGAGMQELVRRWRAGEAWPAAATSVFPEGSFGNGAAMRVAPLGAARADDPAAVTDLAWCQAQPTHAHPVGADGAVVQARAAALAAARGRFGAEELAEAGRAAATDELAGAVAEAAELAGAAEADVAADGTGSGDEAVTTAGQRLGNAVVAHRSVPLALWIAACAGGVGRAVTLAVAAGGDVDTIAAMAGAVRAAAGAAGAERAAGAVPSGWLAAVEDGPALVARAEELAAATRA